MKKMLNIASLVIAITMINGCGGGGDGASTRIDNDSLNVIQTISLINLQAVNGRDDIIGAAYVDTTINYSKTLKIYQQDPIVPNQLLEFGSVYLGIDVLYTGIGDLTLSQDWATVVINGTGVFSYDDSYVALVSLQNHPNYSLDSLIEFPAVFVEHAIAIGNWLVVTSGTSIQIYDISSVASPVLAGSYSSTGDTTSMVSVLDGFYVFTTTGYVYIDYSDPMNVTFSDVSSTELKQTKKAYVVGNKLYIGGPSIVAGNIRIGRVDVSVPTSPVLDFAKDDIAGDYVDFSIDGTNNYSVMTANKLLRYREVGGAFSLDESANYSYEVRIGDNSQLYTWNSRIYTLAIFSGLSISLFR